MESITAEMDKNGEELTGRKKSRFKQLKTRLFGKLKKKESEGLMKQSQSASDITAPEGGREGYDSEDDCLYTQCLSSRALSHDSIFLSDQTQSTEPTRVLSQDNVHGKIKALQLKLQQQNLHLGPPPLLIPGKHTEDSGATSEDDGLPCSPPEMSFHEPVMRGAVYKYSESHKHLSSLSLAGTGSEEEEQGDLFQPSSRPLSPFSPPVISPTLTLTTPSTGVHFGSPAQYMPRLDNSAARHRMSVKPRNQRASTRGKKMPTVSLPPRSRSGSVNDLDNVLSEEDVLESTMPEETVQPQIYSSPTLTQTENLTFSESRSTTHTCSVQNQEEKPAGFEINVPSMGVEDFKIKQSLEPDAKVNTNPLFLQPMAVGLTPMSSGRVSPTRLPEPTQSSRQKEPLRACSPTQRHDKKEILFAENGGSKISQSTSGFGVEIDFQSKKQGSSENLVCDKTDDVSKGGIKVETLFRQNPLPVPQAKKTKMEIKISDTSKEATEPSQKPWQVGVERSKPELVSQTTALSKEVVGSSTGGEGDVKSQTLSSGSFQFSIASAKFRSKPTSEGVGKQNEGSYKDAPGIKIQSNKLNPEPQKDEVRDTKLTELQNYPAYQPQETRSSFRKEVKTTVMSKPTTGNHLKKTETSTEHVESEKTEELDDSRNAFGVKLRATSLSLKYRSEVSKIKDETKRYSLESNQMLAGSEGHAGTAQSLRNQCDSNSNSKPSFPKKQETPTLDSQLGVTDMTMEIRDATGIIKYSNAKPSTRDPPCTEVASEPGWMSVARERTRAYQPFLTRLTTNQATQPHPVPPTAPASQPPKPASQPLTTVPIPLKTQQTANQQSPQVPTQRSPSTLIPCGVKEKQDKGIPTVRSSSPEIDATKKAAVSSKKEGNTRQESMTHTNTEAPTVTSDLPSSSEVFQQQPRSDGGQPSWMELAKRKSLAWSDRTLE